MATEEAVLWGMGQAARKRTAENTDWTGVVAESQS